MEAFTTFRRLAKLVQPVALIAAAFAFFSSPTIGQAEDKEPGKDHPLVGRYEGSKIKSYRAPTYDDAILVQGPISKESHLLKVEGNVTFYDYALPPNRSVLEVWRNYESSLKAKGLEIAFSCRMTEKSCGGDIKGEVLNERTRWPNAYNIWHPFGGCGEPAYLFAKRSGENGITYVSIMVCDRNVHVAVVESKEMDTDKIKFIDASAMQKSLQDTGRVNLYGIHFDFDKDEIKPDSYNTIFEMIKLMQNNPQMKLQIVGHTDSQGLEAHNNDLSNRRAASVVRALLQAGIGVDRLSSKGAGSSQPVATNDTEDGRAKNRRVELVGM